MTADPEACLSSLESVVIDGRPAVPVTMTDPASARVPAADWRIEILPGVHRVSGVVRLDTSRCKSARGDAGVRIAPLEAVFEAGRDYRIGFDHSSIDAGDWRLVLLDETGAVATPSPGDAQ